MNRIIPLIFRGWRHWCDVYFYAGWTVQKHATENSLYRLVSPSNIKTEYKTSDECTAHIDRLKNNGLKPTNPHLVIIVPGLNNVLFTFKRISKTLMNKGYETLIWDYPSNRGNVLSHAECLTSLIQSLEGYETISFVTHSLGGLILRTVLDDETHWRSDMKLGKIVMIAPPHKGSFIADITTDRLKWNKLFDIVAGGVAHDLTSAGAAKLPELKAPVCIIVGGRSKQFGFIPLTQDDNDGLVSIESSRVESAVEFIQIKHWSHTTMLMSKKTCDAILEFFKS